MTSQVEPQVKPHNVKEVVALLAEQFPLCFSLAGAAKPLKIGIFQDLAERLKDNPLVSKTMLRQALRVYTSSWRYLDAVKEGVHRIDLDGVDGDVIDAQQAEHAATSLAESKAKALEARKAKQAAERAKTKAAAAANVEGTVPSAKPAYKKTVAKPTAKPVKPNSAEKKSVQQVKPKPVEVVQDLVTLAPGALVAGAKVLVKLGASPMPATVIEVVKQDVVVQLTSGMVVKTHSGSLYKA